MLICFLELSVANYFDFFLLAYATDANWIFEVLEIIIIIIEPLKLTNAIISQSGIFLFCERITGIQRLRSWVFECSLIIIIINIIMIISYIHNLKIIWTHSANNGVADTSILVSIRAIQPSSSQNLECYWLCHL